MHPAPSIIIFTVLSGSGFGLMAVTGLLAFFEMVPPHIIFGLGTGIIALGLASAGLLASLFHLGRPERAWRALSQWRTSWLSREGVLALILLPFFTLYLFAWFYFGQPPIIVGLGVSFLAGMTVFATAMIYAQLKTVPVWNTWLTPLLFLTVALKGGLLISLFLTLVFYHPSSLGMELRIYVFVFGFLLHFIWAWRAGRSDFSRAGTIESATGLTGFGRVSLFESPHSAPNYLMKEMVFVLARKKAFILYPAGFALGYVLPLLCLFLIRLDYGFMVNLSLAGLGCLSHFSGMIILRWLFFAGAFHVVGLYYGRRK